jgi:hypothetical protein
LLLGRLHVEGAQGIESGIPKIVRVGVGVVRVGITLSRHAEPREQPRLELIIAHHSLILPRVLIPLYVPDENDRRPEREHCRYGVVWGKCHGISCGRRRVPDRQERLAGRGRSPVAGGREKGSGARVTCNTTYFPYR